MDDVAEQVANEQRFFVEFEDKNTFKVMVVRVWKNNELCRDFICRSALPFTELAGELGSLASLLSITSIQTGIVACSGCPVNLIQTLNQSSFFIRGIKMCIRFHSLNFSTLVQKHQHWCIFISPPGTVSLSGHLL